MTKGPAKLWLLFAVVATGAGVLGEATRADGEEVLQESANAEEEPVTEPSRAPLKVETPPRAGDPQETQQQNVPSGTPVKVRAPGNWVLIEAGSFTMGAPLDEDGHRGDDEVQHHVTITRDFILQTTEVTQQQWQEVMGYNPSHFSGCTDAPSAGVTAWCALR